MLALFAAVHDPCLIAPYDGRNMGLILPGLFHHWELNE